MSQTITLSSPATDNTTITACPAWCDELHDTPDSPHGGGLVDIQLTMVDPAYIDTADGPATLPTFVSAELWQEADSHSPMITIIYGPAAELADLELPEMTVDEAERLAYALLLLAARAKVN